jgi:uncharacterized protein (DUF849 family)
MFVKAALNGGRRKENNSAVPLSPREIALESVEAMKAGADVVHVHARTVDGEQTIHPDHIAAMIGAIRAVDDSIVVGTTTGLWTCGGEHLERMRLIEAWSDDALPNFASAAFSEKGAGETAKLIVARGMTLESAVWSTADIPALLESEVLNHNVRILIEPMDVEPGVAVAHAREMARILRAEGVTIPLLYHGKAATAWPVLKAALEDGAQVRAGFEDMEVLDDGRPAESNAQMIRLAKSFGTPDC